MVSVGVGGGIMVVGIVGWTEAVVMVGNWFCIDVDMRTGPSVPPIGVSSVSRCGAVIMCPAFSCWKPKSNCSPSPRLPMVFMSRNCWKSSSAVGCRPWL